jgi:hypothetical protein
MAREAGGRIRDSLRWYVRQSCLAIIHADPLLRKDLDMRTTRLGFNVSSRPGKTHGSGGGPADLAMSRLKELDVL